MLVKPGSKLSLKDWTTRRLPHRCHRLLASISGQGNQHSPDQQQPTQHRLPGLLPTVQLSGGRERSQRLANLLESLFGVVPLRVGFLGLLPFEHGLGRRAGAGLPLTLLMGDFLVSLLGRCPGPLRLRLRLPQGAATFAERVKVIQLVAAGYLLLLPGAGPAAGRHRRDGQPVVPQNGRRTTCRATRRPRWSA